MRIALIQDQLLIKGGSERMFLYMMEEFPEADVYTLAYNPDTAWPEFRKYNISTSCINNLVQTHKSFKILFPLSSYIMQYWDFTPYDVILSSSATVAKYISRFNGVHICYCYYPTRAIWSSQQYFGPLTGLKSILFRSMLWYFKRRDYEAAQRISRFIAISETSQKAIKEYYHREADVLFCPVDVKRFQENLPGHKENFYLMVSRLEKWKRLEYAIEAFNELGYPLKVIGVGEEEGALKAMAGQNIEFLGSVDDTMLTRCYQLARAVIFTPELEYGLVPLEANAAGTPVIAFGKGGIEETMIPLNGLHRNNARPTAVFFYEQTATALKEAIKVFEAAEGEFQQGALIQYSQQFSIPRFKQKLRLLVEAAGQNLISPMGKT